MRDSRNRKPLQMLDPKDRRAFYTPKEFARLANISTDRVLGMIHSGKLHAVRLSERIYRIPLAAVLSTLYPDQVRTPRITKSADPEAEWRADERRWAAEGLRRPRTRVAAKR